MDTTDYAVSIGAVSAAVFVLAGAFLNFLQSGIQIVGVGTVISLTLGTYKLLSDRKENIRRRRMEGIQRLQPKIYDPLLKWAVNAKREIERRGIDEVAFYVASPPDLSAEGDFVAVVGEKLRGNVQNTIELYNLSFSLYLKVREEYRQKILRLIDRLSLGWQLNSVNVIFDRGQEFTVTELPFTYSLEFIKDKAKTAKSIILKHNAEPVASIPCPDEILQALQRSEDLPSLNEIQRARKNLKAQLDALILQLKEAIRKGEPDWRL